MNKKAFDALAGKLHRALAKFLTDEAIFLANGIRHPEDLTVAHFIEWLETEEEETDDEFPKTLERN